MDIEERRAKAREYARRYRERNRELLAAKQRAYYAGHTEERAAYKRDRYWSDPQADNARSRAWREANPDRKRLGDLAWRRANRAYRIEYDRQRRAANPELIRERNRQSYAANADQRRRYDRQRGAQGRHNVQNHGLWPEQTATLIAEQDGRCCYCRRSLPEDRRRVHIDHDHQHCPPGRSCSICRRGIACQACNHIIGLAKDNAELLAVIAANAKPIIAAVRQRIAAAPAQLELLNFDETAG